MQGTVRINNQEAAKLCEELQNEEIIYLGRNDDDRVILKCEKHRTLDIDFWLFTFYEGIEIVFAEAETPQLQIAHLLSDFNPTDEVILYTKIYTGRNAKDICDYSISILDGNNDNILPPTVLFGASPFVCGLFKDNGVWCGFDNRSQDCWVEEFETELQTVQWIYYGSCDD